MNHGTQTRQALFWIILIGALVVGVEGVAHFALWWLDRYRDVRYEPTHTLDLSQRHRRALGELLAGRTRYIGFSATLGWTIKPDAVEGIYRSNAMGIRAAHDISMQPAAGTRRVCTFGDSFTHGEEVALDDTWQAEMSRLRPELEVLNFGVGGFGLDQAYLRYQEFADTIVCDVVFIGFMSENINRLVSVYRPFYVEQTGMPLTKPRFVLDGERLMLRPNPMASLADYQALFDDPKSVLPSLGRHDYYYRSGYAAHALDIFAIWRLARVLQRAYDDELRDRVRVYAPTSEAFALTVRLMTAFHRAVRERGSLPVIVVFADFPDVYGHRHGRRKRYTTLLEALAGNGFLHIDASDAFQRYGDQYPTNSYFTPKLGHYSALGNRLVARYLVDYLDERGPSIVRLK